MSTDDVAKQRMEQGRALDRAAQARVKAAAAEGKTMTYSEAILKELKASPSSYRVYTGVAEAPRSVLATDLSAFERTKAGEHFQNLLDKTAAATPQRKGELDQNYKQRVFAEAKKADPILFRAYNSGGQLPQTDYEELKRRGLFSD